MSSKVKRNKKEKDICYFSYLNRNDYFEHYNDGWKFFVKTDDYGDSNAFCLTDNCQWIFNEDDECKLINFDDITIEYTTNN